jgi:hypothetical protein
LPKSKRPAAVSGVRALFLHSALNAIAQAATECKNIFCPHVASREIPTAMERRRRADGSEAARMHRKSLRGSAMIRQTLANCARLASSENAKQEAMYAVEIAEGATRRLPTDALLRDGR